MKRNILVFLCLGSLLGSSIADAWTLLLPPSYFALSSFTDDNCTVTQQVSVWPLDTSISDGLNQTIYFQYMDFTLRQNVCNNTNCLNCVSLVYAHAYTVNACEGSWWGSTLVSINYLPFIPSGSLATIRGINNTCAASPNGIGNI